MTVTEYREARQTAWQKYEEVECAAQDARTAAVQPALDEYHRTMKPIQDEYDRLKNETWAKYQEASRPAEAEYNRATGPAWKEYVRLRDALFESEYEAGVGEECTLTTLNLNLNYPLNPVNN